LDIFDAGLSEADIAESVLLNVQQDVDTEREAKEEQLEPITDPHPAAILESYQLEHDQRNAAHILEQVDQQLFQRAIVAFHERLATEEAFRLLMEAER
jgi:hypothetical protein